MMTYPIMSIPEPYASRVRIELRRIPTWKLREAYDLLTSGMGSGIAIVDQNRAQATSAVREILFERGAPERPPDDSVAAGMIKGLISHTINDITYEEMNRIIRRLSRMTGPDRHAPQRVGAVLADELGEKKALQYVEKALANALIKQSDYEPLRAAIILTMRRTEIPAPWAGAGARELVAGQNALQHDLGKIRQMGNRTLEKSAEALNRDIQKVRRAWGL